MTKRRSFTALVAIAALASLALLAQQPSDKVKAIGGKFQCMCGCNQILSQCNHVGCSTSKAMLKELSAWVARGDSDTAISQAFVQEFGTTVYAEPPKSGFSLVAWSMPIVYFLVGLALVVFIIRKWRRDPSAVTPEGVAVAGVSPEALARARSLAARETDD